MQYKKNTIYMLLTLSCLYWQQADKQQMARQQNILLTVFGETSKQANLKLTYQNKAIYQAISGSMLLTPTSLPQQPIQILI